MMGKLSGLGSLLKGGASKAGVAAKAAAPALGKVAGGAGSVAGAAGGLVQGAALGAGAAAGQSAVKSFRNRGFPLFIVAAIVFLFTQVTGTPEVYGMISLFFMLYTSIAVFQRKGFLIVLIFIIWYFLLGAGDITSIKYYLAPIVLIAATIHGLVGKISGKEPFLAGAGEEALYGLGAILIFFLDVGLVQYLQADFGFSLPFFVERLLFWVPLWAYVGLFLMMSDESEKSFFVTAAKFVGILYLIAILVVVSGEASGQGKSLLPDTAEFIKAKQEAEAKLPPTENPALSNLKSIAAGRFSDLQPCIQERQQNSQLEAVCKQEGHDKGTPAYADCVKEQKEEAAKQAYTAGGFYTPTVSQPMKAQIKIGDEQITPEYNPEWGYSAEIKISNPSMHTIKATVLCDFTSRAKKEVIHGDVDPALELEVSEEEFGQTFICTPQEELDGTYTLNYTLKLTGLKTESYLVRAFMGTEEEQEMSGKQVLETKKKVLEEIKSTQIAKDSFSAKDFARVNFYLGHTKDNVIVEDKQPMPVLVLTLENIGPGQVTKLDGYTMIFPVGIFDFSGENCKADQIQNFDVKKRKFTFKQCRLEDFPFPELKLGDWKRETITTLLNYDYQVFKKVQISPDQEKISLIK